MFWIYTFKLMYLQKSKFRIIQPSMFLNLIKFLIQGCFLAFNVYANLFVVMKQMDFNVLFS